MRDIYKRARTKAANNTRTQASNLEEIDQQATTTHLSKSSQEDYTAVMIPMTGSAWADEALHHLGHSDDGLCKLCTLGVKQSWHHIIWECDCLRAERETADFKLASLPLAALPMALKYGIAHVMAADFNCTVWGSNPAWLEKDMREMLGADQTTSIQNAVTEATLRENKELGMLRANARQLFQSLIAYVSHNNAALTTPPMTGDSAPDLPNVFTDGALTSPKSHFWG